jgi:transcriptional regulator with XRE-family HTH domain
MFYNLFKVLCEYNSVSSAQVSRDIGINQSTISMWKAQGTTPSTKTISALATYFNVTPEFLLNHEDSTFEVNSTIELKQEARDRGFEDYRKEALLKSFYSLNELGQKKAVDEISDLATHPKYIK